MRSDQKAARPHAAPAHTFDRHDPAHDVVLLYQEDRIKRAPTYRAADIMSAVFTYTGRVAAQITLRHYAGGRWRWSQVIKSTPTLIYLVNVTNSRRGGPHLHLIRSDQVGKGPETTVTCPGMSVRIRPIRDTIRVSVPAQCLDNPEWVRMGLSYDRPVHEGSAYVDDSLIKGTRRTGDRPGPPACTTPDDTERAGPPHTSVVGMPVPGSGINGRSR